MDRKQEDKICEKGRSRGFEEGYAKASDHFFKLVVFVVGSLVVSYLLYRMTGCS